MNSIPCQITKINSKPYQVITEFLELDDKWFVNIKYNSYGRTSVSTEMFDTLEEAEKLKVGDVLHK